MSKVSKANFPNRIAEARALAKFAKIQRDTGKVFDVILPGHEAKKYRVILKWKRTGKDYILQSECNLETGIGLKPCKGNQFNVCYHVLAAIIAVAKAHGSEVAFATNEADAKRMVNLDKYKSANRLLSVQSVEYVWVIS